MAGRSVGRVAIRRRLAAVGLLASLALLGCGGGDDDDAGSDSATKESSSPDAGATAADTGTDADTDSAGSSPAVVVEGDGASDDFPIAAPDGVVLDANAAVGLDMASQRHLLYPNDDFDRVVAFYDDWTSQNGEWSRVDSEGKVFYQFASTDEIRSITVSPDFDPGAMADGPLTQVLLVAG